VMHDPLDPHDEREAPAAEPRTRTPSAPDASDREVPLDAKTLPEALHQWLDGDQVPAQQLSAAEKEVAFWKRINAEAGRRRRMVTPAHVPQQILRKLSDD